MNLKIKVATPVIFVLVMMTVSFLILLSSTATQAAVPDEPMKQVEQAEGSEQAQPIIRPDLTLDVSIAPEPSVGEVVTLRIEVTSAIDEPDASLTVRMSDEIDLIAGDLTLNGSISSAAPLVHEPYS